MVTQPFGLARERKRREDRLTRTRSGEDGRLIEDADGESHTFTSEGVAVPLGCSQGLIATARTSGAAWASKRLKFSAKSPARCFACSS